MILKNLLKLSVFILICYLGFVFDKWIFDLIVKEIPKNEWFGLIKIIVGIVIFLLSASIIIFLATASTFLVGGKNK